MKTRRILAWVMSLALCAALLPAGVRASSPSWSAVWSGVTSESTELTVDADSTATIEHPESFTSFTGTVTFTAAASLTLKIGDATIAKLEPLGDVTDPLTVAVGGWATTGSGTPDNYDLFLTGAEDVKVTPGAGMGPMGFVVAEDNSSITVNAADADFSPKIYADGSSVDVKVAPSMSIEGFLLAVKPGNSNKITFTEASKGDVCTLVPESSFAGFFSYSANTAICGGLCGFTFSPANPGGPSFSGLTMSGTTSVKLTLPAGKGFTLMPLSENYQRVTLLSGNGVFAPEDYIYDESDGPNSFCGVLSVKGTLQEDNITSYSEVTLTQGGAYEYAAGPAPVYSAVDGRVSLAAVYAAAFPGNVYAMSSANGNICDGFGTQFQVSLKGVPLKLAGKSTTCTLTPADDGAMNLTFNQADRGSTPFLSDSMKDGSSIIQVTGGVTSGGKIQVNAGKTVNLHRPYTIPVSVRRGITGKATYIFGSSANTDTVILEDPSSAFFVPDESYPSSNVSVGSSLKTSGYTVANPSTGLFKPKPTTTTPTTTPTTSVGDTEPRNSEPFKQEFDPVMTFDGGKITVSPTSAGVRDTVTLTATPDEGKELTSLTVTHMGVGEVKLNDKGNGVYTFQQPGGNVKFDAKFEDALAQSPQPQPQTQPAQPKVVLSPQKITVNGVEHTVEAYNIDGTNYFKLRDLAAMLRGTPAQFNVEYNAASNAVLVTKGAAYNGSVGTDFTDNSASAVRSPQTVFIDGASVSLTAYNIGGSNFFGLRELATILGYSVDYDAATNTAIIESK